LRALRPPSTPPRLRRPVRPYGTLFCCSNARKVFYSPAFLGLSYYIHTDCTALEVWRLYRFGGLTGCGASPGRVLRRLPRLFGSRLISSPLLNAYNALVWEQIAHTAHPSLGVHVATCRVGFGQVWDAFSHLPGRPAGHTLSQSGSCDRWRTVLGGSSTSFPCIAQVLHPVHA